MNESIEDERGLMSVKDFRRMFFTAFRQSNKEHVNKVYQQLLPLIVEDSENVSIAKLSIFIDYYNYCPINM